MKIHFWGNFTDVDTEELQKWSTSEVKLCMSVSWNSIRYDDFIKSLFDVNKRRQDGF
jgi:hypothetical protein